MAHTNTVLSQLLKLVPRHDFEQLAQTHHCGQKFRKTSRWSQFVALTLGQLSGCVSLRDAVENLNVQSQTHYHLGIKSVARSTLSRVNREQSHELYEALFSRLLQRCQAHAKTHGFRFKQRLISLDASLIDLSSKHIQLATYTPTKCAMKLHLGLDHGGYLPVYAAVTHGQTSDLEMARQFQFKPGDVIVMDKGYTQHAFHKSLTDQGVFFVTRLQRGIPYEVVQEQPGALQPHIVADQVIRFTSLRAQRAQSTPLRLVTYQDPQTGTQYQYLTNHFDLAASTIAVKPTIVGPLVKLGISRCFGLLVKGGGPIFHKLGRRTPA